MPRRGLGTKSKKSEARIQNPEGRNESRIPLNTSVILSGAKNLDTNKISMLRDSSSPAAPQNDIFGDFFSSLLVVNKE